MRVKLDFDTAFHCAVAYGDDFGCVAEHLEEDRIVAGLQIFLDEFETTVAVGDGANGGADETDLDEGKALAGLGVDNATLYAGLLGMGNRKKEVEEC